MIRKCERDDCDVRGRDWPTRQRFCSERCATATRQRNFRDRGGAATVSLESASLGIEYYVPVVWGVETTSEVLAVFADPRFQQMGYRCARKKTPIPRIDRSDPERPS